MTEKRQDQIEARMKELVKEIDESYAREGFSEENVRLNKEFDALQEKESQPPKLMRRQSAMITGLGAKQQ
jgi:GTP cyclohydrolase I